MRHPLTLTALLCLCNALSARTWTSNTGTKLDAELIGLDGTEVRLRLANGTEARVPLARLSSGDQAFLRQQPAPAAGNPSTASWPGVIKVSERSVEIAVAKEDPGQREFIYQSEAFEFSSQAKLAGSVMKEVARTFESTRQLINAMPWSLVCRPPQGRERFVAKLYETRADYINDGGPELSGGVYNSGDKIFKVPFPSLGLVQRGKTYFKDDGYDSGTLVHEITHQLMDEYLPFLPVWVIEGTAEYVEMLPFRAGTFRADDHRAAMKREVDGWEKREQWAPSIDELEAMLRMNRADWNDACSNASSMRRMYHRAQLMVYYFSHLDGDGKGTQFIAFMKQIAAEAESMRKFFADPRVKQLGGGRFSYPRDFPPPDTDPESAPFKHLGLLIGERPSAAIAQGMVEAYKSMGIKVSVK